MNEITRALVPPGIRVYDDSETGAPSYLYKPLWVSMSPAEFACAYWRVRKWRIKVSLTVGNQFLNAQWSASVPFPANNLRNPAGYDRRTFEPLPVETIPENEVELSRAYGTSFLGYYEAPVTYEGISGPLPTDPHFSVHSDSEEGLLTASMFKEVHVEWDENDWRKTLIWARPMGEITAPGLFSGDITLSLIWGDGDPPSFITSEGLPFAYKGIDMKWRWHGSEVKRITSYGWYTSIGGGPVPRAHEDVEGEAILEPEEYWPYASKLGDMPKFDKSTGERISYGA